MKKSVKLLIYHCQELLAQANQDLQNEQTNIHTSYEKNNIPRCIRAHSTEITASFRSSIRIKFIH